MKQKLPPMEEVPLTERRKNTKRLLTIAEAGVRGAAHKYSLRLKRAAELQLILADIDCQIAEKNNHDSSQSTMQVQ